jgi:hypothetical protein
MTQFDQVPMNIWNVFDLKRVRRENLFLYITSISFFHLSAHKLNLNSKNDHIPRAQAIWDSAGQHETRLGSSVRAEQGQDVHVPGRRRREPGVFVYVWLFSALGRVQVLPFWPPSHVHAGRNRG